MTDSKPGFDFILDHLQNGTRGAADSSVGGDALTLAPA